MRAYRVTGRHFINIDQVTRFEMQVHEDGSDRLAIYLADGSEPVHIEGQREIDAFVTRMQKLTVEHDAAATTAR